MNALFRHLAQTFVLLGTEKGGEPSGPLHGLSLAPALSNLSHSFESSRDTCAAARANQVPAGVEYFQTDAVAELVRAPV